MVAPFRNSALHLLSLLVSLSSCWSQPEKESLSLAPSWVSLCGQGHAYLFSTDSSTWANSMETCQLLGGYLARIDTLGENYCLLREPVDAGLLYQLTIPDRGASWPSQDGRQGSFVGEGDVGGEIETLAIVIVTVAQFTRVF